MHMEHTVATVTNFKGCGAHVVATDFFCETDKQTSFTAKINMEVIVDNTCLRFSYALSR